MIALCILIMLIYNSVVIIKYKKIPASLSETAYMIGGEKSLKRYWFTLYCTLTAFTILPVLFKYTADDFQAIPFIFCAGLLFAGFSPAFRSGLDRVVHYVSAYISFGGFLLYEILYMSWVWLVAYMILLGLLCIWKRNCYVYFAELLALTELCIWLFTIL